jgi:protein O-mannosyl-transferase
MPPPNKAIAAKKPADRAAAARSHAAHWRAAGGAALIAAIVFYAYAPSLNGGFIFDDDCYLTNSPLIKSPDGLYQFWCTTKAVDYGPISHTTLWLEWRLWGTCPAGYRVTNVVLHIAASLLIWLILQRMSIPGAFLAAMLFAVHPVNVESVAWISQRKNLTAMIFFLLSILAYLKTELPASPPADRFCRPGTCRWHWLSLAAFVATLLCKGSAATLPLLLLGIVWWLRPLTRWDALRISPFFAVAAALTAVNLFFQTHGEGPFVRSASFVERLLGAGGVVWFYLYKALAPVHLVFFYPQWHIETGDWRWWLPLAAAVAATAVLWRNRNGPCRPFLFAWGFFCIALVPVMGFADVGYMQYSLVADHYQYIALVAIVALAAAGWSVWRRQTGTMHGTALAVAAAAVAILAFLTGRQCNLYQNAMTLYQSALDHYPDSPVAHNVMGRALMDDGQMPKACEHWQEALRLNPDYADAYNNLGFAYAGAGRFSEAIELYEQALRRQPRHPEAYNNLLSALAKAGRMDEVLDRCQKTLQKSPNDSTARYNLGLALLQMGKIPDSIEQFRLASQLQPGSFSIYYNWGIALAQANRLPEAIERLEHAVRLQPDFVDARYNLVAVLLQAGRTSEAVAMAQKALELARAQGRTAQAEQIEKWLQSRPAGPP